MRLPDLVKAMHIAKGPEEDLRPVNVGLLFFSQSPDKFFHRTWIELVWHKDGSEQQFEEHYFKGCLQNQLRNALNFIQTNIIAEKVIKQKDKAEALRFYNFPYGAIEEALSNAVYHKSYEQGTPIEVQVWPDKFEILSFPGPVPPVDAKVLKTKRRIVAREYRNRRIGDFLKELQLTEGRGTGFPAIYDALEKNGSPKPAFETDEDRTYFLTVIPAHPLANRTFIKPGISADIKLTLNSIDDLVGFINQAGDQVSDQVSDQVKEILKKEVTPLTESILFFLYKTERSRDAILANGGLKNHTDNKRRHIDPLLHLGWITYTNPDNPRNPNQKYKITPSGERILWLLGRKNR